MESVILLGGNIGDVRGVLQSCRELLSQRAGSILRVSKVVESPAWGFMSSTKFLNQAVVIDTPLTPMELLMQTQSIERELGRDRSAEIAEKRESGQPYASRVVDVDIITYGQEVVSEDDLVIPHPQMHHREFVLRPMAEVAPQWCHPQLNITTEELLKNIY